ncbi:MAG TPA: hypothetical protein VLS93_01300, partial [Anaeromyxobacteraceae bacterium]|nr:hypothetical protein [Anaeromyxobacteraceae bacterium]
VWVTAGTRVFAVALDGTSILNGAGCDVAGTPASTPAVIDGVAPEVAFVASSGGRVWSVKASAVADGCGTFSPLVDPYVAGPAVDSAGRVLAVSASATPEAFLRQFTYDGAFAQAWGPVRLGEQLLSQPSVSATDACWIAADDFGTRSLLETSAAGASGVSIDLAGANASAAAVLSDGDLVLSVGSYLRRFSSTGIARWTPAAPQLGGVGLAPLVLDDGVATTFLVPTRSGTVHLVATDGTVVWSGTLATGQALGEGNIHTPAGSAFSRAYFTSADGKLHQVIVDGALDTAAPWPKAWHDPRNTGNAATGF